MKKAKKLALLIDADNICASRIDQIIREVSPYGNIVLKRAYGNWCKDTLKNWNGVLKHYAIKAIQQFDYVPGKNTTDIALVIDAMCLLHSGIYDGFAIASSDSDFTPLAIHLHEVGTFVIGVGEERTLEAFQRSCDVFVVLQAAVKEPEIVQPLSLEKPKTAETYDIETIHWLLQEAYTKHLRGDGYALGSSAGTVLKEFDSSFNPKKFGYRNLQALIEGFPQKYEIKWVGMTFSYRCLEEKLRSKRSKKTIAHQNAILEYLDQNGTASRKELDQLLSLSSSATRGILQLMIADGTIVAEGNHINRVYKHSV